MGNLSYKELLQKWQHFMEGGDDVTNISQSVSKSWFRCRAMGLNPHCKLPQVDTSLYDNLMFENREIIKVVGPFIDLVDKLTHGTGFTILLTDKNGIVLQVKGDEQTIQRAKKNNLWIGANRSEQASGTSAFCLALLENKPVQIVGSEHYNVNLHDWTCSTAPIHDVDGNILGALTMSGHHSLTHKHTLGMVVALVQAIEREFFILEKNKVLKLANENLNAVINSVSDGVISIDHEGVITGANTKLEQMLKISKAELINSKISKFFKGKVPLMEPLNCGLDYSDREDVYTIGSNKLSFLTTAKQIRDDHNEVVGIVGILKEKKDVYRMVNKMIGAKAIFTFENIIYASEQMQKAISIAKAVAEVDIRVLLEGESGTGKELFAQAIHNASPRHAGPFVAVNCSAIPRELIESELFGYCEGAFTGAKKGGKIGKFELAEGGTLFLDEINSMPLEMQVKLLRVLQQNEITRIGGEQTIPIDVRIIAASNQPLEQLISKQLFRLDLYYRIGVVVVKIPPLRERVADIPVLFSHLLENISAKSKKQVHYSEEELMPTLCSYEWPGNVRELENFIERAVVLGQDCCLDSSHFPITVNTQNPKSETQTLNPLEVREREVIEKALQTYDGNISKTSKSLRISRNTLYSRIKAYNIRLINK